VINSVYKFKSQNHPTSPTFNLGAPTNWYKVSIKRDSVHRVMFRDLYFNMTEKTLAPIYHNM